jgi:glycosyltransferase involved in cell wall biosynthesis
LKDNKIYKNFDSQPKISVIIFSYNFERYIRESIETVLNQSLSPFEIIICDDFSTDGSWEIISEYAKQYPEIIRSYRHEKNIGMQRNGAFGFKKIKGDLVSSIDGDDCWLPQKLEMEWKALQKYPAARAAYSNVYITDVYGMRTSKWYDGKGAKPPSGDVFVKVFSKYFFQNIRSVFRNELVYRSALETIGFHDKNLQIYLDWDLKIRLTAQFPVVYSGETLVEYRDHEHGIHNLSCEIHYKDILDIYKKNLPLIAFRTKQEAFQIKQGIASFLKRLMPDRLLPFELANVK